MDQQKTNNFMCTRCVLPTLFLTCTLIFAACDSGGANEEDPVIIGQWDGGVTGADIQVTLTLDRTGEGIRGNGNMRTPSQSLALEVEGTYVYPNFSLTLSSQGFQDLNYTGRMQESGDQLRGTLRGSGFNGSLLTLDREEE